MYAGGGLLLPYLESLGFFSQENDYLLQLQEELLQRLSQNHLLDDDNNCQSQLPIITGTSNNLVQTSTISEYDLGGEGDLFKAPEPIIEKPVHTLDPVSTAISMMSAGEDISTTEAIKVADIESIESKKLLSEVFYECKKDLILLEKTAIEEPPSDLSDIEIQPLPAVEDNCIQRESIFAEVPVLKSVSLESLMINDRSTDFPLRPNFLNFQDLDFGSAFGMRRAYSEGDIKVLGKDNASLISANGSIHVPPIELILSMDNHKSEERKEKLSRYWKKKTKRNFGRKIKYACRKALAESQPRIRGRFAKTEECEILKTSIKMP